MSIGEGELESIQPPLENEPGVITCSAWFLEGAVRNPRQVTALIDHSGQRPIIEESITLLDDLYNKSDKERIPRPNNSLHLFWRDIGIMEAARSGCPTSEADKEIFWSITEDKGEISFLRALTFVGVLNEAFLRKTLTPNELSQVKAGGIEEQRDALRDIADPSKAKKMDPQMARAAKHYSEYLLSVSQSQRIAREMSVSAYASLAEGLVGLYSLTVLSGSRSTYDIVSDRLLSMVDRQLAAHGIDHPAYFELSDTLNDSPEHLKRILKKYDREDEKGLVACFAEVDLLVSLAYSLKQLKPHSEETQTVFREILAGLVDHPIIETISLPIDEVKKLNAEAGVDNQDGAVQAMPEAGDDIEIAEILKPMELDWEILPPGELEETARDIVATKMQRSKHPIHIDLDRLNVLAAIRDMWGADKAYYAKGSLGKRGRIIDDGRTYPDEYIILVLQELDHDGTIINEHAIAESPIVGPHAIYVHRQDVSANRFGWREIMSLRKRDAEALGARPVKHSLSKADESLNASLIEKLCALMACTPSEFHSIRFQGNGRISVGRVAVESTLDDETTDII